MLGADALFAAALVAGGVLIGERRMSFAVLMLSVGVGSWVVARFIEPSTTRAAFPETGAQGTRGAT